MMSQSLPTREEINIHDDLDGRWACKDFLGKTLEEAEGLFRQNPLHYGEDLLWMGPIAFRFYVQAAIRFIQSDEGAFQDDFIYGFWGTLKSRLDHEPEELVPIAESLAAVCHYIVENWSKFDFDWKMSHRLPPRFVLLQHAFERLSAEVKATDH
ncbi:MAG: hypothetical protein IAG10_33190 [Planctomycetaceae bacterium]|nr:hypothetical protein [Planctomycetaceae bacterium]